MSPHWNGNQRLVLIALKDGHASVRAIRAQTGLDEDAVRNALRRLCDKSKARRVADGHYEAVSEVPLLAQVWR